MVGRTETPADEATREIQLIGQQRLVVRSDRAGDVVELRAPGGAVTLSIVVTPDGPVLRLDNAGLRIETGGTLSLAAREVHIHGEEGVRVSSGADASIDVAGALRTEAEEQSHRARLGDVELFANDDVKVDGERIRMNC